MKFLITSKLELYGAVLLSKLLKRVVTVYSKNVLLAKIRTFSDSTIVLNWIDKEPIDWPTFITNQVSQILAILPFSYWLHIKSEDNPADYASRDLDPSSFINK